MELAEHVAFWSAVFLFMAAFLRHLHAFTHQSSRGVKQALLLLWLAFAASTLLLGIHWVSTGHPPVVEPYELQISCASFTVLIFLLFQRARMVDPVLALMISPLTFLLFGNAYASRISSAPMGPVYATPWMIVHVVFAWIAFGHFAVAAGASILLLLHRHLDRKYPGRLPSIERLDIAAYRFITVGVVNHMIMIASGAIWAKKAWGHYWSWGALEAWSLLTFLLYVFYLHTRRFLGWKDRRTAWIAAFGLIVLSISYWGIKWLSPSLHPGP